MNYVKSQYRIFSFIHLFIFFIHLFLLLIYSKIFCYSIKSYEIFNIDLYRFIVNKQICLQINTNKQLLYMYCLE